MQRERQGRDTFFNLDHPLRSFPRFANFPSLFGARNPFDDPFFTRPPFASFGGGDPFDDPFRPLGSIVGSPPNNESSNSGSAKDLVIEELDSDDESEVTAKEASMTEEEQYDDQRRKMLSWEPSVEHPDNDAQEDKTMTLTSRSDRNTAQSQRANNQTKSFNVQTCKVTYGGVDGAYYTSTRTRSKGNDGVVLEERKEADKTTGQATHRISRGINDKGHSVTRMLNSDGKVDTLQTLHNLKEDEVENFERSWTATGRGHLHTRNDVRDTRLSEGRRSFMDRGTGRQSSMDRGRSRSDTSTGSGKKVVRINIE